MANWGIISRNKEGEFHLNESGSIPYNTEISYPHHPHSYSKYNRAYFPYSRFRFFLENLKESGLEEDDEASKIIKQLGLLSILPGLDRETMGDAISSLMEWIVRGDRPS